MPLPSLDPQQERRRLTQAFVQFFNHRATHGPLFVVIEDLHWSDDASLETLLTLARRIATQPILILLTCRSDERHPDLTAMRATLERERLAVELHVTPLEYADVDAMLRAIFDLTCPVRAEFLDLVHRK